MGTLTEYERLMVAYALAPDANEWPPHVEGFMNWWMRTPNTTRFCRKTNYYQWVLDCLGLIDDMPEMPKKKSSVRRKGSSKKRR